MKRKPGSSLLIVVLVLTVVSVLTVTGARVLTLNSRQSAFYDASSRARQIAQAGIEEAMARLTTPSTGLDSQGEFGNPASGGDFYPLSPVRRALSGTNCITPVADPPALTAGCPYYDLSIRTTIAVRQSNASDLSKFNTQAFQVADFPSDATVVVPIVTGNTLTFHANLSVTAVSYTLCTSYDGTTGCGSANLVGQDFMVDTTSGSRHSMKIKITYTLPLAPDQGLLKLTGCTVSSSTGFCGIGKGYTTAEVVGFAGEVARVHYIIESHPNSSPPVGPTVREATQYYDLYGFRLPSS